MPSDFKVRIEGPDNEEVVFHASGILTESRTANYDGYNIVHLPSDLFAYRNTTARKFAISGKFVSRTQDEAKENARYLSLIRSWLLPGFGSTGSTPPILKIYAYRNKNINGTPCILRSYSWVFPEDVDYIFSESVDFETMPVIGTLQLELDEAYSAEQLTNREWQISIGESGFFEPGENVSPYGLGSQAINFTNMSNILIAGDKFKGLASSDFDLPSVGGLLSDVGNPLSLLSNPVSLIDQSSQITEDLSKIAAVDENPFISGINIAKIGQSVQDGAVAAANQVTGAVGAVVDGFKRNVGLTSPNVVED